MSRSENPSGDQLTNALHALGVYFILGGRIKNESLRNQPARLIAALAQSDEARLRLSLIPLFLEHPEFSVYVRKVAESITPSARLTLQCYYCAAVWLAEKYPTHDTSLADYFSKDLDLHPTDNPEKNLKELARRHRELSGAQINWLGTYNHAAQVWRKGLELQKA